MIKMSGAEWVAFEDDKSWPDGWYYDDAVVLIDGRERDSFTDDIPAWAKVTVEGGYIDDGTESGQEQLFDK